MTSPSSTNIDDGSNWADSKQKFKGVVVFVFAKCLSLCFKGSCSLGK